MNAAEQLVEIRSAYARAVNDLACTPAAHTYHRRLRQLAVGGLFQTIDALERLHHEEYAMELRPLPHLRTLNIPLAELESLTGYVKGVK